MCEQRRVIVTRGQKEGGAEREYGEGIYFLPPHLSEV